MTTYSTNQVFNICLEITKQYDINTMEKLMEVLSDEQELYDFNDWMFITNILNQTNEQLCCG
jgi:hypothetical protein